MSGQSSPVGFNGDVKAYGDFLKRDQAASGGMATSPAPGAFGSSSAAAAMTSGNADIHSALRRTNSHARQNLSQDQGPYSDTPGRRGGDHRMTPPIPPTAGTTTSTGSIGPADVGSLFRSEQMSLIQLYIPSEMARDTISELGELGAIQFRDLNASANAFQRTFVNEIRRLDEMERKLRFLQKQAEKAGIELGPIGYNTASYARYRTNQEIDTLEEKLSEHEAKLAQMNASHEQLNRRFLELTEMRHVLRETAFFFDQKAGHEASQDRHGGLDIEAEGEHYNKQSTLGFVTGIVPRRRMAAFERVLWRSLRGNLYLDFAEIEQPIIDPVTDETIQKNVFIIFAHGKELLAKIRKICESMGATLYPVDASESKRQSDAVEISARLDDLSNVLANTTATKKAELITLAENLDQWIVTVKKEKGVYFTLNQFNYDAQRKCLIAEGWCPTSMITSIQYALHAATERSGSMIPSILNELRTTKKPPTYHRVNKFTSGFQNIIDAYGIARYREVNPGLFTVITFPFLFAMMFGDVGHGFLMALAAAYMIWKEVPLSKPGKGEMFDMVFAGRYMIFLMGLFSMYTGLIYNDLFSKSFYLRDSQYSFSETASGVVSTATKSVYPIGIDPAWNQASNKLLFVNSYKMKMAILIGVSHMMLGICLQVFNHRHFGHNFGIYVEFIPQALFMMSIFGYLAILIVCKWLVAWNAQAHNAPGLLNTLIFMFLSPGSVSAENQFYRGQAGIQLILVLIAVICIPVMLFGKPYIMKKQHESREALGYGIVHDQQPHLEQPVSHRAETPGQTAPGSRQSDTPEDADLHHVEDAGHAAADEEESDGHGGGHFDFSEIMVNQGIHTIEFCLGCISNTASYLRLWALSLAHAELSEVLWSMVVVKFFGVLGFAGPFLGFTVWFTLTVVILLIMEGLSAFLHALRLHWVEFNGKFYEGSGTKFEPFSFTLLLHDNGDA